MHGQRTHPEVLHPYIPVFLVRGGGRGCGRGSVRGTVVAVDPQQVVQHAPVQVEDGAHHQYVHDLVAVAPVVKEAWTEALRDARDVDDPAQHGQRVHGEEVAQRGGAAAAHSHPAEQEEGEPEQGLPGEGAQPSDAAPSRDGAVDGVAGQQDVDYQGHGADERVAQQRAVDNGQRP